MNLSDLLIYGDIFGGDSGTGGGSSDSPFDGTAKTNWIPVEDIDPVLGMIRLCDKTPTYEQLKKYGVIYFSESIGVRIFPDNIMIEQEGSVEVILGLVETDTEPEVVFMVVPQDVKTDTGEGGATVRKGCYIPEYSGSVSSIPRDVFYIWSSAP